ncbi:[protein-PII] uridylyltransferase [Kitasatospora sp. NPDC092948]|uniref:[protein-PII] uridylyltransferase n=1 Tax=Kitasatospora sp. NPDC092948 TaxID=3364088 RepID=UPI003811CCFF
MAADLVDPAGHRRDRAALLADPALTGPARRAALARLTDDWLAGLFRRADPPPGTALVAVGGYGRGELSPGSDLDLVLLHDGAGSGKAVTELADRLWYPVWDSGVALDHSVRRLAEARAVAAADLRAQLGLLDARHLAGEPDLTAALRTAVLADWRTGAARRLPELRELGLARAERHGELSFLLEPDLKEARGGLRDAVDLDAVAATWLADAPREGLAAARQRLADVRDALHLATGRAADRLNLQDQDRAAALLGLPDADALLREVYRAARTVAYAGDVTWRAVDRLLAARRRPLLRRPFGRPDRTGAVREPLADGVVAQDGEAVLARAARPADDPVLPLRAAAAAAQHGLPISQATVRRLAAECPALPVPWPAEAREQLVTLLGAGRACLPVWEALDSAGLIVRLLPEWERVRCRPQRNPVHTWTVDRHLVETAVRASALTRRVARPDLLLVAALLHDLGKGGPGEHTPVGGVVDHAPVGGAVDHARAGEGVARAVAVRMGFDRADTDTLALLVRHHLTLVETATRRDPDDPATPALITGAVGSAPVLELLHALTEADALATGPAAWSAWRASLVAGLVRRSAAALAGTPPAPPAAPADADEERLAVRAARTGEPVLELRAATGEPGGPAGAELSLAVPERPGLLGTVAGVLALNRLTVRSLTLGELDPIGAGPVLLLRWRVAAAFGEVPSAARLRADLRRALDGSLDPGRRLAERDAAAPRRPGITPPPPVVTVAPGGASATATVLEVRAHDAPGLLHRIGRALDAAGARVRTAHVSTLGADAVDAFYLTDGAGRPLAPDAARALAERVQRALRRPGDDSAAG